MSEIATITRQNISFNREELKKCDTTDCNFLMSSIGWTLNAIGSVLSLLQSDTYERRCFVLTFPNGVKEIFPYTDEEDINHSHIGTSRYNDNLQKAINYAFDKKFNVDSKYISLFSSGKIDQLILKK
ncbi:hypothetical protein SRCM100623_00648 [Acetobacter pasteurianus]|uniref:Uncharacterized protein n=1 Tax=Acetobacter pasteurianus TaxID=438 RepID=A0A1A0DGA7_ACEPA|nr:hypothetical protein [Acetobacter pasteurianus]OAZ74313.1 hypothetical protein SRCM100623_00648 [Acetobacter pasteurianus]